MVTYYQVFG